MTGTASYSKRIIHTWEYRFPVEESPWPVRSTGRTVKYKPTRLVVTAAQVSDEKPRVEVGVVHLYGLRVLKDGAYGAEVHESLWDSYREGYPDFIKEIMANIESEF